jgi:hypothetical protein
MVREDSSYHSHLIFTRSRFHTWFVLQLGGLEGIFALGLCLLFFALIYIFPARFIHTFVGWNCEADRGVVYRFFFLCMVAFTEYMAFTKENTNVQYTRP